MSGTLTSPDFPLNYGFEHNCSWIISVPTGYHILISFDMGDFNIHSCNQSCACDYIEVRAGTTVKGKSIGNFCGGTPPSPIYVRGQESWLRFVTNKDKTNNKGFRATYKAIRSLAGKWVATFLSHLYVQWVCFILSISCSSSICWLYWSISETLVFVLLLMTSYLLKPSGVLNFRNRYCAQFS